MKGNKRKILYIVKFTINCSSEQFGVSKENI